MYRIKPRAIFDVPTTIPDVGLDIHAQEIDRDGDSEPGRNVWVEDDGSTIVYLSERNAAFEIRNGKEILVDPTYVESVEEIGLHLLGPLLRLVLLQRGEFVLHGSVARIGPRTAIFIAPSGRGKSTMAAGLYDRGHDVLSDDAGIVRLESGPSVLAGPSVLKLHEDSADRVDRRTEPVFSDGLEFGKRYYRLLDNETPDRTSLDAVFLLEQGDAIRMEPVSTRDATVELVDNSWGLPDEDGEMLGENLRYCSELAESVIVRRLRYPRSFNVFDEVLNRIEEECNDGR